MCVHIVGNKYDDNASVDDEHYSDMAPTKYLNLYHIIKYKSH